MSLVLDETSAKVLAAVATVIAACVVALVQIFVGREQARAANRAADANARAADAAAANVSNAGRHAVARLRQEWVNALREDLAEFHSIMMSHYSFPFPEEVDRRISMLGTRIELRLNATEDDHTALCKLLADMYDAEDYDTRQTFDREFISTSRKILRAEWKRATAELGQ